MSKQMYCDEEAGQFFPIPDVVEQKSITNADRIRAMTDEELAKWINALDGDNLCPPTCAGCMKVDCEDAWLDWLKQEAQP